MIKKISIFILFILCLPNMFAKRVDKKDTQVIKKEFNEILNSMGVYGSVLIYDIENKTFYSNDFKRAKQGFTPASTFKIANSIIALETGVVENDSNIIFKWNGEKYAFKTWEKDLSLKQAFQVSCVPCYQEIARKIGKTRMLKYLKLLKYKKMLVDSSTIDNFWLKGGSHISQFQQIDFLKRFYFSELPISARTTNIVKDMMVIEKTPTYKISGKTGLGLSSGTNVGWLVGYLELKHKVFFYATNIQPQNGITDDFPSKRIMATKLAFKELKLID